MSKQDGLAYDGSSGAQKRALNAWERDVLLRVLFTALQLQKHLGEPIFAQNQEEADMLIDVLHVLDPRED